MIRSTEFWPTELAKFDLNIVAFFLKHPLYIEREHLESCLDKSTMSLLHLANFFFYLLLLKPL